ncbi:MAG: glycosyltransferase family 4 protein [Clostridium chrysemydis]|uniref:glycosyltransferase family 4 protein n=1 Tax=Clostridium TaxID=1485 RepID=UPI0021525E75|nr:glycosyltransferase family 4 protein [Clostridium sp. LY3-2]MCR6513738.1 glycosyltransferase family 4 protein [Clostridium sp. LY3-2]
MDNKIKVLHIAQANGGVSQYIKTFLKYVDKKNYQHTILVSNQYRDEEKEYRELVDNIEYVEMVREISLKQDLKSILCIRRIIKRLNPDIIYMHSSKAGAIGRVASVGSKAKIIYNAHGWAFDMDISNKKKNMYIFIEKALAKVTDKIVCISKNDYDVAIKEKISNKSKLELIPNGIDIEKFEETKLDNSIRKSYNIPDNNKIIGMVARISEQKSPRTFVEVAKEILKKRKDVTFIMVGDGEQRAEIEEYIFQNNLENNIIITGWVTNTIQITKGFDIAMLTSNWEGFGLVIPEYFISKVPTIASNVGGIRNIIINDKNGILVSNQDINEYCKSIERLLDDDKYYNKIMNNAYKDAKENFDIKRVVKQHEKFFGET